MNYWLMKSEPGDYSFEDLERDGGTRWDGIQNASALIHLRKVKPGGKFTIKIVRAGKRKTLKAKLRG